MNDERMYSVIRYPIESEKSTLIGDRGNQYVFEVARDATKQEIRVSVEQLFKVRVLSVRVLNLRGKQKRFGRTVGQRNDRRKAYVRLHQEDEIDFSNEIGT